MKTVEFNFNYAETHNGDKYFFICLPEDHSGRYVKAEVAERLLACAKWSLGYIRGDLEAHAYSTTKYITAIKELEKAIKQAEEG